MANARVEVNGVARRQLVRVGSDDDLQFAGDDEQQLDAGMLVQPHLLARNVFKVGVERV